MEQILKIGIVDDDSSKVTQILSRLMQGLEGASPEKREKYSHYKFDAVEIELQEDLNIMIKDVMESKLDCLLVDYKLSSYQNVDYTGIELAKALESELYDFPVFVLTSYDDDLFTNEIYNAYQVFDFDRYLSEEQERVELHFKMIEQILKTQKQKENWERELRSLLPLAGTSEDIDSKILDLDSKLEKSINGSHALPDKIKKDLSSNKLSELLDKIDEILKKE
jgi:DNA-binding NarL/FixJ family response regulator